MDAQSESDHARAPTAICKSFSKLQDVYSAKDSYFDKLKDLKKSKEIIEEKNSKIHQLQKYKEKLMTSNAQKRSLKALRMKLSRKEIKICSFNQSTE